LNLIKFDLGQRNIMYNVVSIEFISVRRGEEKRYISSICMHIEEIDTFV
jgi:hypothetical protein